MKAVLIGTLAPDPDVRGVGRLLEENGPKRFARELARILPLGERVRLEVVKQRPGQRAVIRIDTALDGVVRSWFAKLVRRAAGGDPDRLQRMRDLAAGAAAMGVRIPSPCGYLPRYRAILVEALEGAPLIGCGASFASATRSRSTGGPVPAGSAQILRRIGGALAKLHRLPSPTERFEGRRFEIVRIERLRAAVMIHGSELAADLEQELTRLAALSVRPDDDDPTCRARAGLIHGDLHPLQILVQGTAEGTSDLVILDWDAACIGDAERDLGNMIAHLEFEREFGHLPPNVAGEWREALLAGYRDIAVYDPATLHWYYRASLARLAALHANASFGHSPPNPVRLAPALLRAAARNP